SAFLVLVRQALDVVLVELLVFLVLEEGHLVLGAAFAVGLLGEVHADVLGGRRGDAAFDILRVLVGLEHLGLDGLVDLGGLVGLFLEAFGILDDLFLLLLVGLVVGRARADAADLDRLLGVEGRLALRTDRRTAGQVIEL